MNNRRRIRTSSNGEESFNVRRVLTLFICCLFIFAAGCSGTGNKEMVKPGAGGEHVAGADPADQANEPDKTKPNETAASDGKPKTITFSTYYYNAYYEQAKREYEAKHPNITINLHYAAKGDSDMSGQMLEKFRQTTSTELLTGKGPDLIEMDWLSTDKFIGRKLLVNLSTMMEQDSSFKKAQYFQNILDHANPGSGIYAIPLHFYLQALIGDKEAIERSNVSFNDTTWNWNQYNDVLKQLVQKGDYEYGYVYKAQISFIYDMVRGNYSRLVDVENRKANFDNGLFVQLLEQTKAMEEQKIASFNYRNFKKSYFIPVDIYTPGSYVSNLKRSNYGKPAYYLESKGDGQQPGGFFSTYHNLAVNANSRVKTEAWDFLKFLMSGDAELSNDQYFPLSKAAYEKQVNRVLKDGVTVETGENQNETIRVTETDLQDLDAIIAAAVNMKSDIPGEIEKIVFDEVPAFFSGQKSSDAVAKLIQNKVTTYLNE